MQTATLNRPRLYPPQHRTRRTIASCQFLRRIRQAVRVPDVRMRETKSEVFRIDAQLVHTAGGAATGRPGILEAGESGRTHCSVWSFPLSRHGRSCARLRQFCSSDRTYIWTTVQRYRVAHRLQPQGTASSSGGTH